MARQALRDLAAIKVHKVCQDRTDKTAKTVRQDQKDPLDLEDHRVPPDQPAQQDRMAEPVHQAVLGKQDHLVRSL